MSLKPAPCGEGRRPRQSLPTPRPARRPCLATGTRCRESISVRMIDILSRMDTVEHDRRPHHYQFAHKVLAGVARDMGPRMLEAEPDAVGPGMITMWDGFGRQLP